MSTNLERREFLKTGAALAAGAGMAHLAGAQAVSAEKAKCSTPTAAKMGWKVSVAQYTFRRFSLYEALDKIAALGIQFVEPAFFLALDKAQPKVTVSENLSPKGRKQLRAKLADYGIAMSSFYSGLDANQDKARKIFEFCKEMGAGTIVAEPPAEAFDMIEKLCDEFQINLAIHNHPESPNSKYWKPENVLAVCQGRGKRIGACCDTGHWVRSGLDAVECLKKLEGRVLGFHLKDVAEKGNRGSRDVPLGEGKANYAAVLAELKRQGYRGILAIEYEHDSPQLVEDVAKCVAFVEETAKKLAG